MPALFLIVVLLFSGCTDSGDPDGEKDFLIKVGDRKASVYDFKRAFDAAKMAYADEVSDDPRMTLEAQTQLLKEMIEELIILERAEELNLTISDEQLQLAVAEIKADYPEGSFEEVLLKKAVSFSFWKERLKKRLLKQKVIEKELMKDISISPEEIEKFYDTYFGEHKPGLVSDKDTMELTDTIILQLRKEKAQDLYPQWIRSLREKYGVRVNRKAWEKGVSG